MASVLAGCTSSTPTQTQTPVASTATDDVAPAPAAVSQPEKQAVGYLRALNAVPGTGQLSLTADGQKFAMPTYTNVSDFEGVGAEKIEVSAYGSDGKKVSGPMPLDLEKGEDVTVLVAGIPGDVVLIPWKHKNGGPQTDKSKVAFVHSAKALPPVEIKLDGDTLRSDVAFGIATDYKVIEPGAHTFQIVYDKSVEPQVVEVKSPMVITKDAKGNVLNVEQPTPARTVIPRKELVTLTQKVDLAAGKVYSVAVFRDGRELPKIKIMEDKFVPTTVRADDASAAPAPR